MWIPAESELGVDRPSRDVDEFLGVVNGFEDVFPAASWLVDLVVGEVDVGQEIVRHVCVLVEGDLAAFALRKVAVLDARVLGVADAARPVGVVGSLEELEGEADAGAF